MDSSLYAYGLIALPVLSALAAGIVFMAVAWAVNRVRVFIQGILLE